MTAIFTPPSETEDGVLKLDQIEDFDEVLLADSPPGIVGVYTQAGRHFSVLVGDYEITEGEADA